MGVCNATFELSGDSGGDAGIARTTATRPSNNFAYPLILMLLSIIILAIFFVVTSRKTISRCLKLQKADPVYLRRDSVLIGMLQQDMLHRIHSLVMLPIYINNANKFGPAMIPMESTVNFITTTGEVKESTLKIPSRESNSSDDSSECDHSEKKEGLYSNVINEKKPARITSSGPEKKTGPRLEPVPPPISMINVSTIQSPLPGVKILHTQRSTLEVMIPGMNDPMDEKAAERPS